MAKEIIVDAGNKFISKLKPCPFCGIIDLQLTCTENGCWFWIRHKDYEMEGDNQFCCTGPKAQTRRKAITLWNKRA